MRMFIFIFLIISCMNVASAKEMYLGLFASVVNVPENDTFSIRKFSDYHSEKTGALPLDAYVGVDICREVGGSTWCKVLHHVAQRDYDDFNYNSSPGWVNARYLKFINRGYVIINDDTNCNYALDCQEDKCDVVLDYKIDKNTNVISLKTKWIHRQKLWAESNFGAVGNQEGYCTSGSMIEDYLRKKRIKALLKKRCLS